MWIEIVSSHRLKPFLVITAGMVLNCIVLVWLGWFVLGLYRDSGRMTERNLRLQELHGTIVHLDEVLTMSTRMAAATGDMQWEDRYRGHEPLLVAAINEAREISPEVQGDKGLADTDVANMRLVEMENHAFDLVRQGRADEAMAVLSGADYRGQKEVYSKGMQQFAASCSVTIATNQERNRRRSIVQVLTVCLALLSLLFCWILILRVLRRWNEEVSETNQRLGDQAQRQTELNEALQREIFERQQTERALVRRERDLSDIAANVPGAVFQFYSRANGERGLYFVSEGTAEAFGIDNKEADFYERFTAGVSELDRERFVASVEEAIAGAKRWYFEGRFTKPAGETVWFTGAAIPNPRQDEILYNGLLLNTSAQREAEEELRKHRDHLEELIAERSRDLQGANEELQREVEERRKTEDALRTSERSYYEIFNATDDAIFIHDRDTGETLDVNRAVCDLWGMTHDTAMESSIGDLSEGKPPYTTEDGIRWIEKARREGPQRFEWLAQKRGGPLFWVEANLKTATIGGEERILAVVHDITDRKRTAERMERLNSLREGLLLTGQLQEKLKTITDAVVDVFGADFARIWIAREGDLCESGCVHANVDEGPHVCRNRERCLHLLASSGRYTHTDGEVHRRIPYGCYKIGLIAAGQESRFLTNEVVEDPKVHNRKWAARLGLVSFAGYQLLSTTGNPIGALALFSKKRISPEEDALLESLADTTAHVIQAEEARERLGESERRFRSLVRNSSDSVAILSTEGTIQYVSDSVQAILGYSPEDLVGRSTFQYMHPDDVDIVGKALMDVVETPEAVVTVEHRFLHVDGSWVHLESIGCNRLEDPTIQGVVCNSRDISDRKRAEEEMQHLRNYLTNVVNSMPSVLVGVDLDGNVTQWNREAERVTGIDEETARGCRLVEVFPQMETSLVDVRHAIHEHRPQARTKAVWEMDGETHFSDVTVYPLQGEGVEGAVIRIDDVTERVRIEEMMIQSEKMLSIGGLAAGMAHEVNNPLAGMLQSIQVIRNRVSEEIPKNKRVAEECGTTLGTIRSYMEKRGVVTMIESVIDSGARAGKIVENMLSFSRQGDTRLALHNLRELLENTVELATNDYDLKKKYDFRRIDIVREYEDDLPKVPCEASKIQQVFLNLLMNGAEAMHECGAERTPRFVLRLTADDSMANVEIEDNGPGMDEETRKRVFEPFFTTKRIGVGTGLGLSVSYFIVAENHGGRMSVESTPGKGAKFLISLPLETGR